MIIVAVVFATLEERSREPRDRVVYAEPERPPWDSGAVIDGSIADWRAADDLDKAATSAMFLRKYIPSLSHARTNTPGFRTAAWNHRVCVDAMRHQPDKAALDWTAVACVGLADEFTGAEMSLLTDLALAGVITAVAMAAYPEQVEEAVPILVKCVEKSAGDSASAKTAFREVAYSCMQRASFEISELLKG